MKRLLFIVALIFSSQSYAQSNNIVPISNFELWTSLYGDDVIRIQGTSVSNPENCVDADSYVVGTDLSQSVKDRIYSTLLAAVLAKTEVNLVISGCDRSRPRVTTVIIK